MIANFGILTLTSRVKLPKLAIMKAVFPYAGPAMRAPGSSQRSTNPRQRHQADNPATATVSVKQSQMVTICAGRCPGEQRKPNGAGLYHRRDSL
jgi:hypothetical protein